MMDKIKTGSIGENLAAKYLEEKGFTVVAKNYRTRFAEVDLIVRRDNFLVFVEVKTRSSDAYGEPESFVADQQVRRIYSAAEEYIYSVDWKGPIRFDIVSVKPGPAPEITHFEDAIVW